MVESVGASGVKDWDTLGLVNFRKKFLAGNPCRGLFTLLGGGLKKS